ncbi:MAG: ABC transporter permease [Acidobacteriaceae bacterium]|nr:ABC transporter permease [Acidobacteriaceae bacterium]
MIAFFRKLLWITQRRQKEDELREEVQFHLEEDAAERQASGIDEQRAQWAARRELGNVTLVQEDTRAAWGWVLLEQMLQDVRYGVRTMFSNPAFTTLAVSSLALGIGANTAIFSFMDALLMRSLPVQDPASLVVLKWHLPRNKDAGDSVVHNISGQIYVAPKTGHTSAVFPYPSFELIQKSNSVFSGLFAYRPMRKLNVFVQGQAEISSGEYVSGDYFGGLGVRPAGGRLILADDDRAGAPGVVVFSYGYARRRLGNAAGVAGRQVLINNVPFTLIGVAPPEFYGVDPSKAPDVYLPFHADLLLDPGRDPGPTSRYLDDHYYWTEIMGRLRTGVTRAQAQAALAPLFAGWVTGTATKKMERNNLPELLVTDGSSGLDNLRRRYSEPLYILLGMVGLILAIACTNIASLLLARATARRREMAVRLSMGAGRWRVIRQLLTESVLLALAGAAAGILFAIWGIHFLTAVLAGTSETFTLHAQLNPPVMAATSLLAVTTGVLFGLAPALAASRVDPMPALKEIRAAGHSPRVRFEFGRMLMAAQIAICLLLLVGAGLFVRTLANLRSLPMGFGRDDVLLFTINARQAGHRDPEIFSFYHELSQQLAAVPGVLGVTMANSPLIGAGAWGWPVLPLGKDQPEDAPSGHGSGFSRAATHVLGVGPDFFSTMRIPLLAGREFKERDGSGARTEAIVNEAWVKANLPGGKVLGRSVTSFGLRKKPQVMEIIGLAKNTRYDDLTGEYPAIVYLPMEEKLDISVDEMTFFLRTAGIPAGYAKTIRDVVHRADPRIPLTALSTQAEQIEREMAEQALFARLCTAFAMLALAIACVGLYGTASYGAARRTGEIGIRMALGARRITVVWMVLREILILAVVGLAAGIPLALVTSKLVQSVLFDVKPGDPQVMAGAAAILLSSALLAGYLPARRLSRIDPITAGRHE